MWHCGDKEQQHNVVMKKDNLSSGFFSEQPARSNKKFPRWLWNFYATKGCVFYGWDFSHSWMLRSKKSNVAPAKTKKKQNKPSQTKQKAPGQVIQSALFIPDRWRSPTTPWKGNVFTIPKRSRLESPGVFFFFVEYPPPGRAGGESRTIIARWCLRMSAQLAWVGWE